MKSYKLLLAFTLFLAFAFNMKAQYVTNVPTNIRLLKIVS